MALAPPPGWLTTLRYAVALVAVAQAVALPMAPGLAPWSAAFLVPGAVAYALLIGLPVALVLHARGWSGPVRAMIGGLLAGGAPAAIASLLVGDPQGVVLWFGLGLAAGLGAWLLVRLQSLPDRLLGGRLIGALGLASSLLALVATTSISAWAAAVIDGPKDMTCHNLSRYDASSFPVLQSATIRLSERDWPRFRAAVSEAARRGGWSVRDYSRREVLGMSMCLEVGTHLSIQQWTWSDPPWPAARIDVVVPQGGDAWRPAVDGVLARLEEEWPGAVDRAASPGFPYVAPKPPSP